MFTVLIISIIVVIVILLLSVLSVNKGYSYKHSVDSAEDSPYLEDEVSKKN
ncbi:YtzI protein [Bacillus sp. 165]|uniref:YtzI protein n=1 Tax=Bacillus sp. 165 TaxID=1529117 RepID=UPI001ADB6D47|nr:YtzI protein [Bacillus sp. 165]MBO9130922.1 YtzI protein [Bacillus sp. 165]